MTVLVDGFDALIVDADGVIYRGPTAVPHAIPALRSSSVPWCVLTNNAALPPSAIVERISRLDLPIDVANVVTSPQGAVAYLRERGVPPATPILVVGGSGIDEAVAEGGFTPVRDRSANPIAVVQGFGPDVGWRDLSEAGYAIAEGALWVATNMDINIPTERGIAPGNGSLVGVLMQTLGRAPDAVTGKPEPLLFHLAAERMGATRPLVIGDRLDTDIRGANRAGMDSLLVLTGIAGDAELMELIDADPQDRPTYLAEDLRVLAGSLDDARVAPSSPGADLLAQIRRLLGQAWADPDAAGSLRPTLEQAIDSWAGERIAD